MHREPPFNDDAELAVLGACFLAPRALDAARDVLVAEDFYRERHRRVFRVMVDLAAARSAVDPVTVCDELERRGELEAIGGREYVYGTVVDGAPVAGGIDSYAKIVARNATLRRLIELSMNATHAAFEGHEPDAIDAEIENGLALIRARGAGDRTFDDKQAMAAGALAFLRGEQEAGTPYGFVPLDRVLLPIKAGHLILIGGASGSGKSTVARNFIRPWVQRFEERVGLLSLEMTGQEQLELLACIDGKVPVERYYRQQLTETEAARFEHGLALWRDCVGLRINEQGAVTPDQALRIFKRWRSEGVTLFVLDHLHRLDYGAQKDGELRVPIANFARALKSFAKDHACRVVALVQYSKIKPHEEPDDSKIREANNILEESDGVLHIYRPFVACERTPHGVTPVNRDGTGARYFESDAPKGSILAHDPEFVYVKLGKQRRRIRDGLVRIPFNAETWTLYDTKRADT